MTNYSQHRHFSLREQQGSYPLPRRPNSQTFALYRSGGIPHRAGDLPLHSIGVKVLDSPDSLGAKTGVPILVGTSHSFHIRLRETESYI